VRRGPRARVRRLLGLLLLLFATRVQAEPRRVVVLISRDTSTSSWSQGTQAVIAELAARNYQVVVESSAAGSLESLLAALRAALKQPATAAAVTVVRDGNEGIAYVTTLRDAEVIAVRAEQATGAVAEGALALKVTELVRTHTLLTTAESREATPAIRAPSPRDEPIRESPLPAEAPAVNDLPPPLLWLGAGPTFIAHAEGPLVSAVAGARLPLGLPHLALDASLAVSLAPLRFNTAPGEVEVFARQAALHAMFELSPRAPLGLALGLGAAAAWLHETARSNAGFTANADDTLLGLVSLRARGTLQRGYFSIVLGVEPGFLVPAASIRAGNEEVARLGRFWTNVTGGVGLVLP
jgi:hypothetical protein